MVTVPVGRFWSFCFCAAVFGVMTLNPEATSMVSLFCVLLCVLAQLTNSAVHPTAILLRKRCVVGFIDSDLPLVQNPSNLCNALLRLQVLHLPRTGVAAVVRAFFNQFLSGHGVKGNNYPICGAVDYGTMPDVRRDRDPSPFQWCVRIANQNV